MDAHHLIEVTKNPNIPEFRAGDTVQVNYKVREGERTRTQPFQGVVIRRMGGKSAAACFTVRRVTRGFGVERTFPLYSPHIESVQVQRYGKVRRAKLYYLRQRSGRAARIKEQTNLPAWLKVNPAAVAAAAAAAEAEAAAAAAEEELVEEISAEEAEADLEATAEETVDEAAEAAADEAPAEDTADAAEEAPAEDAPAEETAAEDAPAEETVAESEAAVEDAPAEDAVAVAEPVAEDAPAEEPEAEPEPAEADAPTEAAGDAEEKRS